MISVWGKNGAGKSTVASNLACAFARRGQKTALVGANRFYGSIQYYFGMEFPGERSLRSMLAGRDALNIQPYFLEYARQKNLFVASLSNTDDYIGYQRMRTDAVTRFLNLVKKSFQVTIIDCDESTEDPLSMLSLTIAEKIVYVTRPTLQAAVFAKACEGLVAGLRVAEKLRVVFVENSRRSELSSFAPFGLAGPRAVLPFCREIEGAEGEGVPILLTRGLSRASRVYRREIETIASRLTAAEGEAAEADAPKAEAAAAGAVKSGAGEGESEVCDA
jgi:MinD-like ATPase involved in chromosome partitioning or flagellar assembly